ncbi:hypothetical protein P7C70_g1178, partial [Phenoliferia sp. Uapishka_3]
MASIAPNSNDILDSARFQTRSSGSSSRYDDAPTAASILGSSTIDPASLHPLAGLVDSKDLDYLLLDDDKISGVEGGKSVLPSRGWGDELCYGTGSTYLAAVYLATSECLLTLSAMYSNAGLAAGGLWGLREGIRKPLAARAPTPLSSTPVASTSATPPATSQPTASAIGAQARAFAEGTAAKAGAAATGGPDVKTAAQNAAKVSSRLRWNNILNQVTRRGSFTGNSAGVLALIYNGFNSTLDSYRGGKHDIYGSMFAGACTGALWKCTAGIKPMLITSGLMTVGAAGWTTVKMQFL